VSTAFQRASLYLSELLRSHAPEQLLERLQPRPEEPLGKIPGGAEIDEAAVEVRWQRLPEAAAAGKALLLDPCTREHMGRYARNIENFVGTVKLPVGVAGPLRVNGVFAHGDYLVPLATTEAALVASYHRGATLISHAGGCTSVLLEEGVGRAPGFAFRNVAEVGSFLAWVVTQRERFREVAATTTRHGVLKDLRISVEGNHVYLILEFSTGDACGQNMVTIATDAVCRYIAQHAPVQPRYFFIEANLSGDKKASAQSYQTVRGKKVTAEVIVAAKRVQRFLHTTPQRIIDYWRMSAMGGVLSGTMGVQGHFANALAALYIACGQDAACVAESAVGITRMELTETGALYAAVTLPNIMVGTVGGGTGLPSQRACLQILGLAGPGHARALAEVCAALCLGGELSIIGALCAGDFARAHQERARGNGPQEATSGAAR
jgi:hydroxymethylglutaryl-CoA reductase (NADPH)